MTTSGKVGGSCNYLIFTGTNLTETENPIQNTRPAVIKLHGSMSKQKSLIFTRSCLKIDRINRKGALKRNDSLSVHDDSLWVISHRVVFSKIFQLIDWSANVLCLSLARFGLLPSRISLPIRPLCAEFCRSPDLPQSPPQTCSPCRASRSFR